MISVLAGCQTRDFHNVQVSRSYPNGQCREIGQVIGNANSRDGARQQAYDDLRYRASQLEGNYVRLLAETYNGTAMRGIAYKCR